jgi:hypothetical protein
MEDYLPVGGHLLPADFQAFICKWNMTIAKYSGLSGHEGWGGEKRKAFRLAFPKAWKMWCKLSKAYSQKYADQVAALKDYQLEQAEAEAEDEDDDEDQEKELRELRRLEEHERQEAAEMDYLISLQ